MHAGALVKDEFISDSDQSRESDDEATFLRCLTHGGIFRSLVLILAAAREKHSALRDDGRYVTSFVPHDGVATRT